MTHTPGVSSLGTFDPEPVAAAPRTGWGLPVALACTIALFLPGACSSTRSALGGTVYVHPNADIASYERIAVLPLGNMSNDRFASDRVREVLSIELAAMGLFEVIDAGRVNAALIRREIGDLSVLEPEVLSQLAADLDVQGIVLGNVLELGVQSTSTFQAPQVSLSLRLVDAQSGIVAWSVTDARRGLPLQTRLFGVGEKTQTEVIRELVRTLMSDLYQAAGS